MKIEKFVEISDNLEIDIDADDIRACLRESINDADTKATVLNTLNNIAQFINGIPDELLNEITDKQKQIVYEFMVNAANRFAK